MNVFEKRLLVFILNKKYTKQEKQDEPDPLYVPWFFDIIKPKVGELAHIQKRNEAHYGIYTSSRPHGIQFAGWLK